MRRRTKPTMVDQYEVFCAVLYLLRTGCQWRLSVLADGSYVGEPLAQAVKEIYLAFLALLLRRL